MEPLWNPPSHRPSSSRSVSSRSSRSSISSPRIITMAPDPYGRDSPPFTGSNSILSHSPPPTPPSPSNITWAVIPQVIPRPLIAERTEDIHIPVLAQPFDRRGRVRFSDSQASDATPNIPLASRRNLPVETASSESDTEQPRPIRRRTIRHAGTRLGRR
jgi:hypothetical protein